MKSVFDTILVLDNDLISLWCYRNKQMIHHVVHRPVGGLPLRHALKQGTEALKANQSVRWLSDERANAALTPDDMNHLPDVWFPETQKAGWKYWAIVLPERAADQLSFKLLAKTFSERGLIVETFTEPDPAMQWLLTQGPNQSVF
jgi:hypothetical protein